MEETSSSGHSSVRSTSRRSSQSPSYFKNVVSLGPDSLSQIPLSPMPTTATKKEGGTIINSQDNNNNNNTLDNNGDTTTHDGITNIASIYKIPHDHHQGVTPITTNVRSRHRHHSNRKQHRRGRRRKRLPEQQQHKNGIEFLPPRYCSYCNYCLGKIFWCCNDRKIVRSTLSCMNVVARVLSWCTVVASLAAVIWYSYELKKTG
ncbi:MAG: hypothetical protein ACI8RD_002720 [Bacillariaceae sp.]|jgi:hypothetical protein